MSTWLGDGEQSAFYFSAPPSSKGAPLFNAQGSTTNHRAVLN
ncbi:hypothetical protein [Prochlorococcus sp. MIT 1313]